MHKLISEIIQLPDRVRKGDFVLNLSKGVTEPEKTLAQYVVTPQMVACFNDALRFIRSAVEAANSKACYLHGTFVSHSSLGIDKRRQAEGRHDRTAIRDRYGLNELPGKATSHAIAARLRPYASVASWYCWRSLDLARNPETVAKGYPS